MNEPTVVAPQGGEEVTWDNSPISQVYNPDGTLKEGGAQALIDQGYDDIAGFTTRNGQGLYDALKQGKEAQAAYSSKIEGMVKIPGDDSSDEDRANFSKSIGAGQSAEDIAKDIWPSDLPDDFPKDEKLATSLSEWAASNPVNTPEAVKDLAARYILHQDETMEAFNQEQEEAATKAATETCETLTKEMGGAKEFSKFSGDVKDFFTSKEAQDIGFKFTKDAEGKIYSENKLHAAMLSDPSILRMLKSVVKASNPARLPGGNATPGKVDSANDEARAIIARGYSQPGDRERYNEIRGIKV